MLILSLFLILRINSVAEPQFQRQVLDDQVSIGYGIALGDVDGDGKTDVLLADKKQFVWYRNGDWKKFVMVENLTERDNVCIAAADINGDGKVEVAVGAQWNPGETSDPAISGSVHYLLAPDDPTLRWEPVQLQHVPTIHRMRWARSIDGKPYLLVAPLHGIGNRAGEGEGVRLMAYEFPLNPKDNWKVTTLDQSMHLTHNLDVWENADGGQDLFFAGKEGVKVVRGFNGSASAGKAEVLAGMTYGAGEVRAGRELIATIEPMHGNRVAIYMIDGSERIVLDEGLKEGHALAVADFTGDGATQVVAGWRSADANGDIGIKIYQQNNSSLEWTASWIDKNGIACEDLQVADLDGDGRPEIVAAGRASNNLIIYWNKSN